MKRRLLLLVTVLALAAGGVLMGAEPDTGEHRNFSVVPSRAGPPSGVVDGVPAWAQRLPPYQREVGGRGYLAAYFRHGAGDLYDQPGGRVTRTLRNRTEFGSLRIFAVVRRAERGRWLGVLTPDVPNGAVAWVDAREAWLYRVQWLLDADISARRVTMIRDGRVVGSFPVAVGRPGAETPLGRFAITDKLLIDPGTPYGCCVLALSGHQPRIQQGWGGGDRLGIHATDNPTSIGEAASLGCLRAPQDVMRRLVYQVPLGTRVQIHA